MVWATQVDVVQSDLMGPSSGGMAWWRRNGSVSCFFVGRIQFLNFVLKKCKLILMKAIVANVGFNKF